MRKFKIETWGCQMNEYDSQKMAGILKSYGFEETKNDEEAEIFILNTCSVREKAAHKIFTRVGVIRKNFGKDKIVGITGCVASHEAEQLFKKIPKLNFVLGTRSVHLVAKAVKTALEGKRFCDTSDHPESIEISPDLVDRQKKVKAYVSIIEGCDNFCTYCVVPYTRGRERSRPVEDIVEEIKVAVNKYGIKEVELLGQNVNSYNYNGKTFKDVLIEVDKIKELKRIRFLTSHPKDFNEELVKVIASSERICKYIHLPMQSGSNKILKLMGRKYTREEYLEKIDMLRSYIPDAVISSDFIVAFPGEEEEDFLLTMDAIQKVQYDNIFSFKYSPRPKTAALRLKENVVSKEIADKRLIVLQKYQEKVQEIKHKNMEGKVYEVLVESVSKRNKTRLTGRTEGNHVVNFEAGRGEDLIGKFVKVKITSSTFTSLKGILV